MLNLFEFIARVEMESRNEEGGQGQVGEGEVRGVQERAGEMENQTSPLIRGGAAQDGAEFHV